MAAILKAISDLNVGPFEAAMGRMERRVDRFSSQNLAQLGRAIGSVFSVYAATAFVKSIGQAADGLADLAQTTGVGVENLQALQVLFKENGKNAEDVTGVLSRLKKAMDEATSNTQIAQSFQRLGISFQSVASLSPDRVLEMIARSLRQSAGDMQKSEAAGNLLGRGYAELQGAMQALAQQGLDPLRESLKSTNQIMGEGAVQAAARAQEAYEKAGRQLRTMGSNMVTKAGVGLLALWRTIVGTGTLGEEVDKLLGGPHVVEAVSREELDRRRANRAAMERAASGRSGAAIASANAWYAEQVNKISVGDVKAADQLGAIGGYVGAQSSPAAQIAERQLRILELQKELSERIAKATETSANGIAAVATRLEE